MKIAISIATLLLSGCAVTEVDKSISRDNTMNNMAKTALINEMLNSSDPHVRSRGAAIAEQFVIEPKKKWLGF